MRLPPVAAPSAGTVVTADPAPLPRAPAVQAPALARAPEAPLPDALPAPGAEKSGGPGHGARDTAGAGLVRTALAGWGRPDAAAMRAHLAGVAESLYAPRGAKNQAFDAAGRIASGIDVEAIARAPVFSMYLSGPGAADALVAAGVALARDVPSVYLCHSRKDLPWFLREADQSHPGRVHIIEADSIDGLARAASKLDPAVFAAKAAPESAPALDTFIGCLMSGLTDDQYAEGRQQLLAIHGTLKDRLGSPHNHCEGILVESTNSFGTPKESLLMDERAIRGAERCVFYQYDSASRPSGMWVEAGLALGLGKPSTFLLPNLDGAPPSLAGLAGGAVKIVPYGDHTALAALLEQAPAALLPAG